MHNQPGTRAPAAFRHTPAVIAAGLTLLLGLLQGTSPLLAQRFGQWWWEGSAGVGRRDAETEVGGVPVSVVDEQHVRLDLGLNGFLGHPALGSFHLGVGLALEDLAGNREINSDRTTLDLDLRLLPRGPYPLRLFVRRGQFTYSGEDVEPLLLSGPPETTTRIGGRLRLRKGPLRGALVGFDQTHLSFMDNESRVFEDETEERQFIDWSRRPGRLQQNLRLEHHARDFGSLGLEFDDLSLALDQKADVTSVWKWQLFGLGRLRDTTVRKSVTQSTETLRLRNRFFRPMREDDQLDLRFDTNFVRTGFSSATYSLALFYRWRPWRGWEVAPFLEMAQQVSDRIDVRTPRGGVSFSRSRRGKRWDSLVSSLLTFSSVTRDEGDESRDESFLGFSLAGSIGHGEAGRGLRKELEGEYGRNELELGREPIPDLPDLGLTGSGLSHVDSLRARLTLSHRWERTGLSAWSEWKQQTSRRDFLDRGFENESVTATLQANVPGLDLSVSAGETRLLQDPFPEQDLSFLALSATWRPYRLLSFRANFRVDERQLFQSPDIDGERLEVGVRFQFGQLVLTGFVFESDELLATGSRRNSRGISWMLSRRFAGWLPVVTGTRRQGVIR